MKITLDLNNIKASKIIKQITKKDGTVITQRNYGTKEAPVMKDIRDYEVDIIDLKTPKLITEGQGKNGTWYLYKTGLVIEPKEPTDNTPMVVIAEVKKFTNAPITAGITKEELARAAKVSAQNAQTIEYPTEEINPEDIPFN